MKVNDRVTVKTDGGPRRPGVVLAVEEFSEGTMYLVSLEDYLLGIWFFNEAGHQDGIFVEKASPSPTPVIRFIDKPSCSLVANTRSTSANLPATNKVTRSFRGKHRGHNKS